MKIKREHYLEYIMGVMLLLNFFILVFYQFIMVYVVDYVKRQGNSRELISHLSWIPYQVHHAAYIVVILFIMLAMVVTYRNRVSSSTELFLGLVFLELILCICIVYYSSVAYNGIILLVVADISSLIYSRYGQVIFLVCMSMVYIISNYYVLSTFTPMASFAEFLFIFPKLTQTMILGFKDILSSVNIIFFIIYMIILMRNQVKEKEEVKILNEELKQLNLDLQDANEKLQDYAAIQKQLGETEERNRIAREIHDTLGHTMTGLAAGLDACRMLIDVSVPDTKDQIGMLADVAREGLGDIRRSVNKLRPDALEHHSLEYAIKKIIKQNMEVSHVDIDYICEIRAMRFNSDQEDIIFRIVQEAMTNAIRHGKATHIYIHIWREDIYFMVQIQDNGCGCEDIQSGFGLIHMKERVDMLQGILTLDGSDGFSVLAKIPMRWNDYD